LTLFDSADLREADIGGLKLVDAKLFKGATISLNQAAELLGKLGINVA
jgi:fluoroquinolone resistance protein